MNEEYTLSEKTGFIVALFAALIALNFYYDFVSVAYLIKHPMG